MHAAPNEKDALLISSFETRWDHALQSLDATLRDSGRVIDVRPGDEVGFQQQKVAGAYLVSFGQLQMSIHERGISRAIRVCGAGQLVGYGTWFVPEKKYYSLLALEKARVRFYTETKLKDLRLHSFEISELIIEALCRIIDIKDDLICTLEQVSAVDRVKSLLDSLLDNFGVVDKEGQLIGSRVSRRSLAQMSGVTAESFSRILTDLEDQGVIKRRRRNIVVVDRSHLRPLEKSLSDKPTDAGL